jgi:hypothetical protein
LVVANSNPTSCEMRGLFFMPMLPLGQFHVSRSLAVVLFSYHSVCRAGVPEQAAGVPGAGHGAGDLGGAARTLHG